MWGRWPEINHMSKISKKQSPWPALALAIFLLAVFFTPTSYIIGVCVVTPVLGLAAAALFSKFKVD